MLAALETKGRSTVAAEIAQKTGELQVHYDRNDEDYKGLSNPEHSEDHSRKFGEHLGKGISGKGRRHDELESSDHILEILRGGGLHTLSLIHI